MFYYFTHCHVLLFEGLDVQYLFVGRRLWARIAVVPEINIDLSMKTFLFDNCDTAL